jgi:hypothetical protein
LLVDKEVKDDEEDEDDKEFVEFVSREANENDPISRISIGQSEPGTTLDEDDSYDADSGAFPPPPPPTLLLPPALESEACCCNDAVIIETVLIEEGVEDRLFFKRAILCGITITGAEMKALASTLFLPDTTAASIDAEADATIDAMYD